MMDDYAVMISNLQKSFNIYNNGGKKRTFVNRECKPHIVLDGIDLKIRKGESVGILGRNGSGKSTLLKIISGIIEPSKGTVSVNGKVASILELNMGLHDDLTGVENIIVRSKMYGIPEKVVKTRLNDIIKYADIGDYIYSPVRMYSSGMKSRLAFAIMINVDADIFIIDEALSIGDYEFNTKSATYIKQLIKSGKTVLMTGHSAHNIKDSCNRAIILDSGKIINDGDPNTVCSYYGRVALDTEEKIQLYAEQGLPTAKYMLMKRLSTSYDDDSKCDLLNLLSESANGGCETAMIEYADHLMSINRDDEARKLYRLAANKNNRQAKMKLSLSYSSFNNEILNNLKVMAEKGDHYDEYRYALIKFNLATTEKEYEEAFSLFYESSSNGNPDAKYNVALMKLYGLGTNISPEESIAEFEALANEGHVISMKKLIQLFSRSYFVEPDEAKVFKWTLALAKAGDPEYQYKLAEMYCNGFTVEKNESEAIKWFEKYIMSSTGKTILDSAYASEHFGEKLPLNSFGIYKALINSNNQFAMKKYLSQLLDSDNIKSPDYVFSLCKEAASSSGVLKVFLADCYYKGVGTPVDMGKAFELYRISADFGEPRAMITLATMYRDGVGTKADQYLYLKYLRMAAKNNDSVALSLINDNKGDILNRIKKITRPNKFNRRKESQSKRDDKIQRMLQNNNEGN